MKQIQYDDVKCTGTLKIDIEDENNIYMYVEDANGHHAEIKLSNKTGVGNVLRDYIENPGKKHVIFY